MEWNHLPVAGGIYDQHPKLLEEWQIIFHIKAEYEREKEARDAMRNKNQMGRK